MPTFTISQFSNLTANLSMSVSEIETKLGKPTKQTIEQGDLFYWYGSNVGAKATLYRFHEEKVIWIQIDISKEKITLADFFQSMGKAEFSVDQQEGVGDSLRTKVVAWPSQGVDVIASGDDRTAFVTRLAFFKPIGLSEYKQSFGAKYANNQKLNLEVTSTPFIERTRSKLTISTTPEFEKNPFDDPQTRNNLGFVITLVCAIIFIFSVSWYIQKTKKQAPQAQ